jgi:quinol-cytochrome oxidoreductase complex cytochrome b subunit
MNVTGLVMMLGVFGVPALLVWAGHKLRRRSPQWRSAFLGAVVGHVLAMVVGSVAAMTPPEAWKATDLLRGALAVWSFTLFPLVGALVGLVAGKRQY